MSAPHGVLNNHDFNIQFDHEGKTHWVSRPDVRLRLPLLKPEHIGLVGTRTCFFLKLIDQKSTARGFDVFTFHDEVGNHFISFSDALTVKDSSIVDDSNIIDAPLEVGTCYVVKATIKRHATDTYNPGNHSQNHINRVVVLKKVGKKE